MEENSEDSKNNKNIVESEVSEKIDNKENIIKADDVWTDSESATEEKHTLQVLNFEKFKVVHEKKENDKIQPEENDLEKIKKLVLTEKIEEKNIFFTILTSSGVAIVVGFILIFLYLFFFYDFFLSHVAMETYKRVKDSFVFHYTSTIGLKRSKKRYEEFLKELEEASK